MATTTTEQFSLRWNNFHSNLTAGFHDLLEAAEMVDVTLAVDGHFLQAHKIVLSICSPYFKRMFKVNPCKHPIVIIKDVAHENMKDILEFMYLGEVSVLRENLSSFLRTAELLQVKGLTGDDTSDTSSGKDVKLEGDNEDDGDHFPNYEQMIETEIDSYVQSTNNPQPSSSARPVTNTKRAKNINTNGTPKKSKPNHQEANPQSTNTPVQNLAVNNLKTESVSSQNKLKSDEGNDSEMMGLNLTNDSNKQTSSTTAQDDNNEGDVKLSTGNNWCPPPVGHYVTDGSVEQGQPKFVSAKHRYPCEKCSKRFSRRDHLRTHVKNIHGEDAGPFACSVCAQLYKNMESLRKHFAKFHQLSTISNSHNFVASTDKVTKIDDEIPT